MGILQFIASRNFIVLNKDLINLLGLEEAVLFGELCSEYDYWEKQDMLKDGYFFSTIENIQTNTTLSEHKQRKALENLKKQNIVTVKLMGIPAKRYIRINEEVVLQFFNCKFLKNSGTGTEEIQELDAEKLSTNNNIVNNNDINKNNIIKDIVEYLNLKAFKKFRSNNKTTQQHISARLSEGYQLEDFKKVIDNKCDEWLKSEMEQYLRPQTLFGTKFESYLNAPARMNPGKMSTDQRTQRAMDYWSKQQPQENESNLDDEFFSSVDDFPEGK